MEPLETPGQTKHKASGIEEGGRAFARLCDSETKSHLPREVHLATSLSTFTHRVACPADLVYPGIEERILGTSPYQKDKHVHWALTVYLATKCTVLWSCRERRLRGSVALALVHVRKAEIPENPNDLPGEMRGASACGHGVPNLWNHSVHIVCSSQAAPQPTYLFVKEGPSRFHSRSIFPKGVTPKKKLNRSNHIHLLTKPILGKEKTSFWDRCLGSGGVGGGSLVKLMFLLIFLDHSLVGFLEVLGQDNVAVLTDSQHSALERE